jgi:hypothetical protein
MNKTTVTVFDALLQFNKILEILCSAGESCGAFL